MHYHNSQINPIYKAGKSDAAVLLIHGFTGTPDSMRPLANHLNNLGFTVSAPLLAGHGTTKEALEKTGWKDWYQTCQKAFEDLRQKHGQIFVAGLSLGGVLTLKLAEDSGNAITAISCLAAPIFLKPWIHTILPFVVKTPLKHLYRYQKKMATDAKDPEVKKNYWSNQEMPLASIYSLTRLQSDVRSKLSKIECPTLLMHSRYDSTAPYESMATIAKHLSSKITETVTLENSFHLITIDYEKDIVCQKVGEFFMRYL